ncbi:hypothetical protein MNBD_PLANCTO03-1270, partial [hydrothermal vent metagenome]
MTKAQVGWMAAVMGVVGVAGGVVVGLGSSVANAQEAGPLEGPGIEVREVPGVTASFGTGDAGRFGARERSVPLPIFLEAINSLSSEEADEGLALSAAQLEYLRVEVRAFREELAAFAEASGDEVRALVGQLPQHERGRAAGEIRRLERLGQMLDRLEKSDGFLRAERRSFRERNGEELDRRPRRSGEKKEGFSLRFRRQPEGAVGEPGSMMEPMQERMEAGDGPLDAHARLVELQSAAPSQGELEIRLWEMLAEPQREVVGAALDAYLAEVQARREEQRLAKEIERRKGSAKGRTPSDRKRGENAQGVRGLGLDNATMGRVLEVLDTGTIPQKLWSRLPDRIR